MASTNVIPKNAELESRVMVGEAVGEYAAWLISKATQF
jgi:hypothetical protein